MLVSLASRLEPREAFAAIGRTFISVSGAFDAWR